MAGSNSSSKFVIGAIFVCLLHCSGVTSAATHSKRSIEAHHRTRRQALPTSRDIDVVVNWLKRNLPTMGMELCNNEDAYEGIRCPGTDIHDGMCASWDEICDGVQKCGLRKKDLCIENLLRETSLSRRAAEDQCSGEESKNACDIRAKEPPRCGEDYELSREGVNAVELTSPLYPSRYPGDMHCFWRVKGPADAKLTVEFIEFDTEENYDYLNLGEGHKCDPVARGKYAVYKHSGSRLPETPTFTVNRNEIFVTFRSDSYDHGSGFRILVSIATHGVTDIWTMRPPEVNKTCGGMVNIERNGQATITSPNYPQEYDNLYECDWVIMAEKGRRLGLEFHDFVTEMKADFLTIGSGRKPGKNQLHSLSGRDAPAEILIIESNKGWVRFSTDDSNRRKGFKIIVYDYPYNECGGSHEIPRDGSAVVASPLYPSRAYRLNQQCLWQFNITKGRKLSVVIEDFALSYDDILSVGSGIRPAYDWSNYILKEASGNGLPRPKKFIVRKNSVWFYFRSNDANVDRGFKAEIFDSSLYKPKKKPKMGRRIRPTPCGYNVGREDIVEKITITSPGYPGPYGSLMECIWVIDIPFGGNIRMSFDFLNLENHLDVLTIGNGTNPSKKKSEVMSYTGFETPPSYEGFFNQMWLRFNSDVKNQYGGFSLTIKPRPYTDCGGELYVPRGGSLALASPNYPGVYPRNAICRYVIHGPLHHRITMSIAGFETEPNADTLTMTEGCPTSNSTAGSNILLDAHSGRSRPTNYQMVPRSSSVWMEFKTNRRMQLHGFIINFADANLKAVADETVGCPVYNRTSPEDWITRTQDTRF